LLCRAQGNSSVSAKTLAPVYWGVAPYPTYFFALMQKSKQKKIKATPASHEKLRLQAEKI
jgi:hypothetical protein